MKKRYQMSIIFELEDEDEFQMDRTAEELESRCFNEIRRDVNDTFEDMVWVVDENGKCIGSL